MRDIQIDSLTVCMLLYPKSRDLLVKAPARHECGLHGNLKTRYSKAQSSSCAGGATDVFSRDKIRPRQENP